MNLTVRINDIEYKANCVQGVTFAEEYNETLDSGTIRLTHIPKIKKLRPYDDVYIYSTQYIADTASDSIWGQHSKGDEVNFNAVVGSLRLQRELVDAPIFYRHLLVDQFTENIINLSEGIFAYTIELFSETKRLEKVQLPNISITQPLKYSKKVSVYEYLNRYIELYSPKYKTIDRDRTKIRCWKYIRRYSIDPELESVFGSVYAPDFTLSNPTLRDVLSQLMIVADMIPYVKDDVIYAKDISKRRNHFDLKDLKTQNIIGNITATMSSDDYCDSVRRQYSNALSSEGICNYVDYLGFRNKNIALMTLGNMELETTYPIYKINKMYMCYYKKGTLYNSDGTSSSKYFLCKQDITKLVKLDSEWKVLSQDWNNVQTAINNIDEYSKYQLTTVRYSQGGNIISGWGEVYDKPYEAVLGIYDVEKTRLENIICFMDNYAPFGINSEQDILKWLNASESRFTPTTALKSNVFQNILVPNDLSGNALPMKGFFFQIEYKGFYNGALIHSRDKGNDNIISNDNSSSSLALLEKDGLNQKEKLNRFANKTYMMNGRYEDDDITKLINLGDYTEVDDEDDDVIIYKREYSIYNNMIIVSYAGINDYVLKNYFTSVYSKYRTYQLMSYGESVLRAENRKALFVLSKNKKFKDENDLFTNLNIEELFSFFVPNDDYRDYSDDNGNEFAINNGYILGKENEIDDNLNVNKYSSDENTFTSGNSLCFNITMSDNISGGNYIDEWSSGYDELAKKPSNDPNYTIGSKQKWYNLADDEETGAIENMGFYVGHNKTVNDIKALSGKNDIFNNTYKYIQNLPALTESNNYPIEIKNSFGLQEKIYKDNKERIDMTFQLEPISIDKNIFISDWMFKLSNLYNSYIKSKETKTYTYEVDVERDPIFLRFRTEAVSNDLMIDMYDGNGNQLSINDVKERFYISNKPTLMDFKFDDIFRSAIIGDKIYQSSVGVGTGITRFYIYTTILSTDIEVIRIKRADDGKLLKVSAGFNDPRTGEEEFDYLEFGPVVPPGGGGYYATCRVKAPSPYENSGFYPTLPKLTPTQTYIEKQITFVERADLFTINKNMRIKLSNYSIDKTIIYKEYESNYDDWDDVDIEDIFSIQKDSENQYYIKIDISQISNDINSIQYWYLDDKNAYNRNIYNTDTTGIHDIYTYTPTERSYKFVFGINITDEDRNNANNEIRIYISKMENRDERVFDSVGRKIGKIHNCVDEGIYITPTEYKYDIEYDDPSLVTITVNSNNYNYGMVLGDGIYYQNEIVNMKAIPQSNCEFVKWNDNIIDIEREITADTNRTYTAIFYKWFEDNISTKFFEIDRNNGTRFYQNNGINKIKISGICGYNTFGTNSYKLVNNPFNDSYKFNDIIIDATENYNEETAKTIYDTGYYGSITSSGPHIKAYIDNGVLVFTGFYRPIIDVNNTNAIIKLTKLEYLRESEQAGTISYTPQWHTMWETTEDDISAVSNIPSSYTYMTNNIHYGCLFTEVGIEERNNVRIDGQYGLIITGTQFQNKEAPFYVNNTLLGVTNRLEVDEMKVYGRKSLQFKIKSTSDTFPMLITRIQQLY